MEHEIDIALVMPDGTYTFPFQLIGLNPGAFGVVLFWKIPLFGEALCSAALIAIRTTAAALHPGDTTAQKAAICAAMGSMTGAAAAVCKEFPRVFRTWWASYKCGGKRPY